MKKKPLLQSLISYILSTLIFTIFVCVDIHANPANSDNLLKATPEVEKLDPSMTLHENVGCPENSYCNPSMGQKMNAWNNQLKIFKSNQDMENYMKKEGIPIAAWAIMEKYENQDLIVWDSHCPSHNQKGNKIKEIILFSKGSFQETDTLLYEDIYLMNSPENIVHYLIPRNERPIYMDGGSLVFIKEENDRYLGIKIDAKANLEITNIQTPSELPVKIDCPPQLKEKYKAQKNNKTLYEGYQCQNIWNMQGKKFEQIMYPITCI